MAGVVLRRAKPGSGEDGPECVAIAVGRRLASEDVLERLAWLFVTRGVPEHIRSDNGSEFTARVVRDWLEKVGVSTQYAEPGSPWKDGLIEVFNGKLRCVCYDDLHSGVCALDRDDSGPAGGFVELIGRRPKRQ